MRIGLESSRDAAVSRRDFNVAQAIDDVLKKDFVASEEPCSLYKSLERNLNQSSSSESSSSESSDGEETQGDTPDVSDIAGMLTSNTIADSTSNIANSSHCYPCDWADLTDCKVDKPPDKYGRCGDGTVHRICQSSACREHGFNVDAGETGNLRCPKCHPNALAIHNLRTHTESPSRPHRRPASNRTLPDNWTPRRTPQPSQKATPNNINRLPKRHALSTHDHDPGEYFEVTNANGLLVSHLFDPLVFPLPTDDGVNSNVSFAPFQPSQPTMSPAKSPPLPPKAPEVPVAPTHSSPATKQAFSSGRARLQTSLDLTVPPVHEFLPDLDGEKLLRECDLELGLVVQPDDDWFQEDTNIENVPFPSTTRDQCPVVDPDKAEEIAESLDFRSLSHYKCHKQDGDFVYITFREIEPVHINVKSSELKRYIEVITSPLGEVDSVRIKPKSEWTAANDLSRSEWFIDLCSSHLPDHYQIRFENVAFRKSNISSSSGR